MSEQGLKGVLPDSTMFSNEQGDSGTQVRQKNQDLLGNAAIQEQMKSGSAIVLGSAANSENAYDDSFTPHLLQSLQDNPTQDLDTTLLSLETLILPEPEPLLSKEDKALAPSNIPPRREHHATTSQYGDLDSPKEGEKIAVLIGNELYHHLSPLGTPIMEANQMASELESRDYDTEVLTDQNAEGMEYVWQNMIENANPGDELVAFFGGHGNENGLLGVEHQAAQPDILEKGLISSMAQTATSQGKHIRFIMDSCHSGSTVETAREDYTDTFTSSNASQEQIILLNALQLTQAVKEDLLKQVHLRGTYVENLERTIEQHLWKQYLTKTLPQDLYAPKLSQKDIAKKLNNIRDNYMKSPAITQRLQAYDQQNAHVIETYFQDIGEVHTQISMVSNIMLPSPPEKVKDHKTFGAEINYCDELLNSIQELLQ